MLIGERVRLRTVRRADLETLQAWHNDPEAAGSYNMFALQRADGMAERFEEHGFIAETHGMLLVVSPGDELLGSVTWHQVAYGPNSGSRTFNFGISLAPTHRGKGYGTEAQRLLAGYLFDTFPIVRVEASTDITNLPEQRSLEKAGFTREGVLRKAQWRAGEWHDLVVYSKLRGE